MKAPLFELRETSKGALVALRNALIAEDPQTGELVPYVPITPADARRMAAALLCIADKMQHTT